MVADRIFYVWSMITVTNPDIFQKAKAVFDTTLAPTQNAIEAFELFTYLITPPAFYSLLLLIIGAVVMVIS